MGLASRGMSTKFRWDGSEEARPEASRSVEQAISNEAGAESTRIGMLMITVSWASRYNIENP